MKENLTLTRRLDRADKLAKYYRVCFYFCLLGCVALAVVLVFCCTVSMFCAFFVCVGITLVMDYLVNHFEAAANAFRLQNIEGKATKTSSARNSE